MGHLLLRSSLVAVCALGAASVARADLGPEQSIDAPAFASASGDQQEPSIAFGAGIYLAVWRDGDKDVGQVWDLHAARINPDGTFIDQAPIVLRDIGEDLLIPAVAFDGKNFLVVWERSTSSGDINGSDIFGCYVDPATGAVSDEIPIAVGPYTQSQPSIAGGDGYALVTYNNFATNYTAQGVQTVWGVLLGSDQTVIKPSFQINPDGAQALCTSVAWSSAAQKFGVAYRDSDAYGDIFGTQIDPTGVVATPFGLSQNQFSASDVSVGVLGSGFVVGWTESSVFPTAIYARAFPASGGPTANAFQLASAPNSGGLYTPQILGVGGEYVGVWEQQRTDAAFQGLVDIYGGRFLADGTLSDGSSGVQALIGAPVIPPSLPSIGDSFRSAVASAGDTGLAVLWRTSNHLYGLDDVVFLPLDPSTSGWKAHTPTPIAHELNLERTWSVATNGTEFLLVWEGNRDDVSTDGGLDVFGLRVGLDGTPIDTAPFVISVDDTTPTLGATGDQFTPYASGIQGGPFLVVWADGRGLSQGSGIDLYAARIDNTGAPVQIAQHITTVADAQMQPTIAASDKGWLVAWEDWSPSLTSGTGQHRSAVFSTFVPVTDSGQAFTQYQLSLSSALAETACAPVVTWNGAHFLVAYEQPCAEDFMQPQSNIVGRWHGPDGTPVPGLVSIASKTFSEVSPTLAAAGDTIFAAWQEDAAETGILATSIADLATTVSATPTIVYTAPGVRKAPALTTAGGVLLASWIEEAPAQISAIRLKATPALPAFDTTPLVLHTGAVYEGPDSLSTSEDPSGSTLSFTPRFTPKPAMIASATGQTLVAYNSLDATATTTARAQFRQLGLAGNGTACTTSEACGSAICTAGVCCDVVCDGVCQACSADGCVVTPPSDPHCPSDSTTSCATLSTSCRTYADAAPQSGVCAAFGQCASPSTPGVCTTFTDQPDGTSCSAPGCTVAAACQAGACVCSAESNMLEPARGLSCSAAPGQVDGTNAAVILFALFALLGFARRRAST